MLEDFYKMEPTDKIWHTRRIGVIGEILFSFDKKTVYNLFTDFHKLTPEQKALFKKENPALIHLITE